MAISYEQWRSRLTTDLTDKQIDQSVMVKPKSLSSLREMSLHAASSHLEINLSQIFIPSSQTRAVLRLLQASAAIYISDRYPTAKEYSLINHSSDGDIGRYEPKLAPSCLLGLPGVGKSTVVGAFRRLFPSAEVLIPSLSATVLRSNWQMSIRGGNTVNQLVIDHFRNPAGARRGAIFQATQRELCNQGVPLLIADELQFLTQGQGNTLPAKLLGQLCRLGPPLVFVANYSLIHRLNTRPQEEKQRLLTKPQFLHPDPASSEDWVSFIQQVLQIAPEFSKLPVDKMQFTLHSYSFGLRRLVCKLMCGAYMEMRKQDRTFVEVRDIDHAYASVAYASCREDVEMLISDLARARKRFDLWCPLPGSDAPTQDSKVVDHPAKDAYQQRMSQAALVSSITQEERLASGLAKTSKSNARTVPSKPRSKASAADLIDSALDLRDDLDKL